jgi:predicted RNase H-like HicB family nuclease
MSLKYKVKVIFLAEDNEYVCFVDGMKGITGYGDTEHEAIEDFEKALEIISSCEIHENSGPTQEKLYRQLKKEVVAKFNGMQMSCPLALTKLMRLEVKK